MIVTIRFACTDCKREAVITVPPPNSFGYGDTADSGGYFHLDHIPIPQGWNHRINQIERCAACRDKFLALMQPVWHEQRSARLSEFGKLSALELLAAAMKAGTASSTGHEMFEALKEQLAGQV